MVMARPDEGGSGGDNLGNRRPKETAARIPAVKIEMRNEIRALPNDTWCSSWIPMIPTTTDQNRGGKSPDHGIQPISMAGVRE